MTISSALLPSGGMHRCDVTHQRRKSVREVAVTLFSLFLASPTKWESQMEPSSSTGCRQIFSLANMANIHFINQKHKSNTTQLLPLFVDVLSWNRTHNLLAAALTTANFSNVAPVSIRWEKATFTGLLLAATSLLMLVLNKPNGPSSAQRLEVKVTSIPKYTLYF